MNKANRELRHDLEAAVQHIEDYAGEIFRKATMEGLGEYSGAMEKVERIHLLTDRLKAYVEEIKDQKIKRE